MMILEVLLKIVLYTFVAIYYAVTSILALYACRSIITLLKEWSKEKELKKLLLIIGGSLLVITYFIFLLWLGVCMFQWI